MLRAELMEGGIERRKSVRREDRQRRIRVKSRVMCK